MADIKHSRDAGRRRAAKHGGKSLLAPTLGVHTSELGEHRCAFATFTQSCAWIRLSASRAVAG